MSRPKHPRQWKRTTHHVSDLKDFFEVPGTAGRYWIHRNGRIVATCKNWPEWFVAVTVRKSKSTRHTPPFNILYIFWPGGSKHGVRTTVGRLLLLTFVGPPPSPKHLVAHRNGVSDDDRVENLLWAVSKDIKHGQVARGTYVHGERCHNQRHTPDMVQAVRKLVNDYSVPPYLLATAMEVKNTRVMEFLNKTWNPMKWDGLENPLTKGADETI